MRKRFFLVLIIPICLSLAGFAGTQQTDQKTQLDNTQFMRAKLRHSKDIVEGLALENYQAIAKNAQDLALLSHESNWNVFQTLDYVQMSGDFRLSANRLRDAAKAKNLDGATLAYFEVTINCVRCHKLVRQKRHVESKKSSEK